MIKKLITRKSAVLIISAVLLSMGLFTVYKYTFRVQEQVISICVLDGVDTKIFSESYAESLLASQTGITIIFDLHGVLLGVDAKKAFGEVGFSNVYKYASACNISFSCVQHALTKKLYDILNAIQPIGNTDNILDPSGNRLPGLMCEWQKGLRSNKELNALVIRAINDHPEWFSSAIEKQLVSQIATKMFTPAQLVSTIKILSDGIDLVKKYKQEGHTLIILSNWDPESFACLYEENPNFFAPFDAILISGNTHHAKPGKNAYQCLVNRKKKYGERIIVIDDQQENVDAACALGLEGVVCPFKSDFLGFSYTPNISGLQKRVSSMLSH